jgi:predicted metal-binding protein
MKDRKALERLFREQGVGDFKWLDPKKIVVSHWVRMKCAFGCSNYGQGACCPPNAPSVEECVEFLSEYREAVIIHFPKRLGDLRKRRAWTKGVNAGLLKLEREVFLAGNQKAFVLPIGPCSLCKECVKSRADCRHMEGARPTPEALAIDVFSTARLVGYPIEVLKDHSERMNRYAILLID